MTYYRTSDGATFKAKDAADFVHQLRMASFKPDKNEKEFIGELIDRANMMNARVVIPAEPVEAFVAGLIKAKVVEIVEADDGSIEAHENENKKSRT